MNPADQAVTLCQHTIHHIHNPTNSSGTPRDSSSLGFCTLLTSKHFTRNWRSEQLQLSPLSLFVFLSAPGIGLLWKVGEASRFPCIFRTQGPICFSFFLAINAFTCCYFASHVSNTGRMLTNFQLDSWSVTNREACSTCVDLTLAPS